MLLKVLTVHCSVAGPYSHCSPCSLEAKEETGDSTEVFAGDLARGASGDRGGAGNVSGEATGDVGAAAEEANGDAAGNRTSDAACCGTAKVVGEMRGTAETGE